MPDLSIVPQQHTPEYVLNLIKRARADLESVEHPTEIAQLVSVTEEIEHLAKKAKLSEEVQQQASKTAILSKRRAGEILKKTPLSKGGRPGNRSHDASGSLPTLDELGIDKDDSSRWQQLAAVTANKLEKHLDQLIEDGEELTTKEATWFARQEAPPPMRKGGWQPEMSLRPDATPEDYDHNIVARAYKLVNAAQALGMWLNPQEFNRTPALLWQQADDEETAYLADQLPKAAKLIEKFMAAYKRRSA